MSPVSAERSLRYGFTADTGDSFWNKTSPYRKRLWRRFLFREYGASLWVSGYHRNADVHLWLAAGRLSELLFQKTNQHLDSDQSGLRIQKRCSLEKFVDRICPSRCVLVSEPRTHFLPSNSTENSTPCLKKASWWHRLVQQVHVSQHAVHLLICHHRPRAQGFFLIRSLAGLDALSLSSDLYHVEVVCEPWPRVMRPRLWNSLARSDMTGFRRVRSFARLMRESEREEQERENRLANRWVNGENPGLTWERRSEEEQMQSITNSRCTWALSGLFVRRGWV